MLKECQQQQQQKRKKTSTLMGETCLYLYFDGCICGLTYRDMQNTVPSLNLPWNNDDEPYPDHTWIARTFKKIPLKYLEDILTRSASICVCKNQDLRKKKDYCCWLQIAPV